MTVAEIDEQIAAALATLEANDKLIAEAEALKPRQKDLRKELAQLYRDKAKASIAELKGK